MQVQSLLNKKKITRMYVTVTVNAKESDTDIEINQNSCCFVDVVRRTSKNLDFAIFVFFADSKSINEEIVISIYKMTFIEDTLIILISQVSPESQIFLCHA